MFGNLVKLSKSFIFNCPGEKLGIALLLKTISGSCLDELERLYLIGHARWQQGAILNMFGINIGPMPHI